MFHTWPERGLPRSRRVVLHPAYECAVQVDTAYVGCGHLNWRCLHGISCVMSQVAVFMATQSTMLVVADHAASHRSFSKSRLKGLRMILVETQSQPSHKRIPTLTRFFFFRMSAKPHLLDRAPHLPRRHPQLAKTPRGSRIPTITTANACASAGWRLLLPPPKHPRRRQHRRRFSRVLPHVFFSPSREPLYHSPYTIRL